MLSLQPCLTGCRALSESKVFPHTTVLTGSFEPIWDLRILEWINRTIQQQARIDIIQWHSTVGGTTITPSLSAPQNKPSQQSSLKWSKKTILNILNEKVNESNSKLCHCSLERASVTGTPSQITKEKKQPLKYGSKMTRALVLQR